MSDDVQKDSNQNVDATEVLKSIGVEASDQSESAKADASSASMAKEDDPLAIKKRLGQQAKKHQRELSGLQSQIYELQSQLSQQQRPQQTSSSSYSASGDAGIDEGQIQHIVSLAFKAKEDEERKLKQMQHHAYYAQELEKLDHSLDGASEKYEDFDDVVRGDRTLPFTNQIRDMLLLFPKSTATDVLYHLGKNKEELKRISELHPIEQGRELLRLGMALMAGDKASSSKNDAGAQPSPSQIKVNPSPSARADDNSYESMRRRMRDGTFK